MNSGHLTTLREKLKVGVLDIPKHPLYGMPDSALEVGIDHRGAVDPQKVGHEEGAEELVPDLYVIHTPSMRHWTEAFVQMISYFILTESGSRPIQVSSSHSTTTVTLKIVALRLNGGTFTTKSMYL